MGVLAYALPILLSEPFSRSSQVASDDGDVVVEGDALSDVEATEEDLETAQEKKVRKGEELAPRELTNQRAI